MAIQIYKPYIGVGQVYGRVAGASVAHLPFGNVSVLKLSVDEESKELADYTRAGGGTYAEVKRVKGVGVELTLHDYNAQNLALALFGSQSETASGTATDEPHVAYKNGLMRLNHPSPTSVVVKSNDGATTFSAGTDYEVRQEGVFVLSGSTIADGATVKTTYAYGAYNVVEALTQSGVVMEMSFGGLNEAESGKPVVVDLYRVSLGAAKDVSLIGNDFAELTLSGRVLMDPAKTGSGVSRYFKVSLA